MKKNYNSFSDGWIAKRNQESSLFYPKGIWNEHPEDNFGGVITNCYPSESDLEESREYVKAKEEKKKKKIVRIEAYLQEINPNPLSNPDVGDPNQPGITTGFLCQDPDLSKLYPSHSHSLYQNLWKGQEQDKQMVHNYQQELFYHHVL